jgi:choline-sulfatase
LCAPARASFMSGQLPRRTRVYDNAAEFASDIPTFAHHLRAAGYHTVLSGKMHFVGPDQLHGFEERLTTDIYPADFGWTPDYSKPGERIDWWYHNLGSVTGAGVAEITNQLEYDDEVAFHACAKLYDLSRRLDDRPWCMTVSFTHPHDPYVARRRFWDLYADCPALDPTVAPIAYDAQDPHSQRLMNACDFESMVVTEEDVRRSRRAYFANISYVDEKIGEILDVLKRGQMDDNTIVVFVSDHGDMLGERGLWFKMSFFDGSARVPLLIKAPGLAPGLVRQPVSTLDVLPTLADLAGIDLGAIMPWTDGESLVGLANGTGSRGPVPMEYAAEGSEAPLVALRDGEFKLILCDLDPPQLYDVAADPHELINLAGDPAYGEVFVRLKAEMAARWDLARFDAEVRASQACRHVVYGALRNGAYYPWDYQPLRLASERYMRNHMDLNVLEASKRYPRE